MAFVNKFYQLADDIQKCKNCDLCKLRVNKKHVRFPEHGKVFSTGNYNAKLFFVGESPYIKRVYGEKDKRIRPFNFDNEHETTTGSGRMLFNALWALNVNREDIYITNLIKCSYDDENRYKIHSAFDKCSDFVFDEINLVHPKIVFLLGDLVSKYFGVEFNTYQIIDEMYFCSIYHPAYIFRTQSKKEEYKNQIQKFLNLLS